MSKTPRSTVDLLREALAYVDSWLEYRVWKLRAPGAQVAVWFDGEIQFSKAYGVSNIGTGEKLTTAHLFRVASHSKTFTATAVMQLVEAGKLRLDDTAGSWISELKEAGSPLADATVRELVSHSAGVIRDGVDSTFWAHSRPFPDEAELLELSMREGAVRQPEATFKYTNIGFSLLGLIIGKAAGSSYNEYVKTAIIEKLGLRNTGPELDEARLSEYAGGHSGLSSWRSARSLPTSTRTRWRRRPGSIPPRKTWCGSPPPTSSATAASSATARRTRCSGLSGRARIPMPRRMATATARASNTTTGIAWSGTRAGIRATSPARCGTRTKGSPSPC